MPKQAIDYSKAVLYRIVCCDLEVKDQYVGSTTNFPDRKSHHKGACNSTGNKDHHCYVYRFIREHGGWDNWQMVEIERFHCLDKRQLHTRERYHIERLGATLNQCLPTRTQADWVHDNAEHVAERLRIYYQDNKAEISIKQKAYNDKNKEHLREYFKQYGQTHAASIAVRNGELIICECGQSITRGKKTPHQKTKRHLDAMAALTPPTPEPEVVAPVLEG